MGDKVESPGLEELVASNEEGVLLYYKFVQICEPEKIRNWLFDLSSSLDLLGRIRVAPDGINVTVGGKMAALHEHMQVVGSDPLFENIDFKLSAYVNPVNEGVAAECGFSSLSARIVKEVVTLGLHPSVEKPLVSKAGRHVTAVEFHDILQGAAMVSGSRSWSNSSDPVCIVAGNSFDIGLNSTVSLALYTRSFPCIDGTQDGDEALSKLSEDLGGPAGKRGSVSPKKLVILDARNIYETRIGKFSAPQGVEVIDPMIRQYSDLPGWIDENEDHLRDNRILMYCTGGVRCEMASAYIRSKGKEFEDVLQLSGGIQRYLEAFPDGGYFTGKNFVFDHRLAVPSSAKEVVGSCLLCGAPFDNYSARCRCSLCRMLVLVCTCCQVAGVQDPGGPEYICELCSKDRKTSKGSICPSRMPPLNSKGEIKEHKLRVLCLHGFRQSASSLKGRLNALRKKLRHRVDLVFVDAPHEIPPIKLRYPGQSSVQGLAISGSQVDAEDPSLQAYSVLEGSPKTANTSSRKFAWLIGPEKVGGNPLSECLNERVVTGRFNDSEGPPDRAAAIFCLPQRQVLNAECTSSSVGQSKSGPTNSIFAQCQTQTEGWIRSCDHLKTLFSQMGPFDGILGFSQGAAVAAALCTLRSSVFPEEFSFKFVILCSGFCIPHMKQQLLMSLSSAKAAVNIPSLHVFGGTPGVDRQIDVCESEDLALLFNSDERMIVRHNSGHIIPTQQEYVQQYLKFLNKFM